MTDREAFPKALAENEDDTATRLVYADWLDDGGEHQRKWPAAKAWLVRFCRSVGGDATNDRPEEHHPSGYFDLSHTGLLLLARREIENVDENELDFYGGANESLMEALRVYHAEFWANWSVVTCRPSPPDFELVKGHYSCSW